MTDDDDDLVLEACPACGGEAQTLGAMGRRTAYRCRDCGWTFTTPAADPADDGAAERRLEDDPDFQAAMAGAVAAASEWPELAGQRCADPFGVGCLGWLAYDATRDGLRCCVTCWLAMRLRGRAGLADFYRSGADVAATVLATVGEAPNAAAADAAGLLVVALVLGVASPGWVPADHAGPHGHDWRAVAARLLASERQRVLGVYPPHRLPALTLAQQHFEARWDAGMPGPDG